MKRFFINILFSLSSFAAMAQVYGMTPAELNRAFTDHVSLFRIDEALERRLAQLLEE